MNIPKALIPLLPILLLIINNSLVATADDDSDLETYIIQVKNPHNNSLIHLPEFMKPFYSSLLSAANTVNHDDTIFPASASDRIIHSYSHAMTGFAARLTKSELEAMKKQPWFLYAYPDLEYELLTTHTPAFLGVDNTYWAHKNFGEGVIIGVVDSGISPAHPSFRDEGMPPAPARWKGSCAFPITCTNKIIGAKSLVAGMTPLDDLSHGTHTASTATGTLVHATVVDGPSGSAAGMAPRAHLAVYKVCNKRGCLSSDILAGIGAAIRDGCDVISLSLGTAEWKPFDQDPVTIGSLSAVRQGIFVSAAAGNSGPGKSTLRNEAPWLLTVGASTMDRQATAVVKLGNGQTFIGQSMHQPDFPPTQLPLVYAGDSRVPDARFCVDGAFQDYNVTGMIVICDSGVISKVSKGQVVQEAGGAGMIMVNDEEEGYHIEGDAHLLPASHVSYVDGVFIKYYINSTRHPTATILFEGWTFGTQAPVLASFSSRGPNVASKGILKPDIIGPGVTVLASVPVLGYAVDSGTSMSTPHLSGIAALLRASHPDWTPSMIKSALMTTAYTVDNKGNQILSDDNWKTASFFAVGAGHVNATAANDPGLVYEISNSEYLAYLCGMNMTNEQLTGVFNGSKLLDCSKVSKIEEKDLNYPSITVSLWNQQLVSRRLTNVGEENSTYRAVVDAPAGVSIEVNPPVLTFPKLGSQMDYMLSIKKTGGDKGHVEGQIKWISDKHTVRSPISIELE